MFTDSSEKDFRKSDVREKCPFANHYEQLLRNGHSDRVDKTLKANRPKDPWLNTRAVNSDSPHQSSGVLWGWREYNAPCCHSQLSQGQLYQFSCGFMVALGGESEGQAAWRKREEGARFSWPGLGVADTACAPVPLMRTESPHEEESWALCLAVCPKEGPTTDKLASLMFSYIIFCL